MTKTILARFDLGTDRLSCWRGQYMLTNFEIIKRFEPSTSQEANVLYRHSLGFLYETLGYLQRTYSVGIVYTTQIISFNIFIVAGSIFFLLICSCLSLHSEYWQINFHLKATLHFQRQITRISITETKKTYYLC